MTANTDFEIGSGYKQFTAKKDVVATGHTITCNMGSYDANFEKKVDASIVWKGKGTLTLSGTSPNADNALELQKGTNVMSSTAVWGGTNIVVTGSATTLDLKARGTLSKDAVIRLVDGGKVRLDRGVGVHIAELYVGSERIPDGRYTAASLPSAVAGEGRLTVGPQGVILLVR